MEASTNPLDTEPIPPAPAILASTLLDIELDRRRASEQHIPWLTGIKGLDSILPKDLWTGEKVIGVANIGGDESLSAHIITSHLLSLQQSKTGASVPTDPVASTFIITPPSTRIVSSIHDILLASTTTKTDPLPLLDTVHLLQYLDTPGLSESLAEVAEHLYLATTQPNAPPQPTILLLTSLTQTLTSLTRRSGATHTNALLAHLLRQLTHLSHTHPSLLVLIELELELEPSRGKDGALDAEDAAVLDSAFANTPGASLRLSLAGAAGRLLERGMDCIVATWARDRQSVVEVVKDRTGSGLGTWAVWEG